MRCATFAKTAARRPTHPLADEALRKRLGRGVKLLAEIRDGKHSIHGVLVRVDRYFADRPRHPVTRGDRISSL